MAERPADASVVQRNYDQLGHLASIDYPNGSLSYIYDLKSGHTSQVSDKEGNALSYFYDGDLHVGSQWSGTVNGSVQRAYNQDFRLAAITVNSGDPVNIGYDDDGYITAAGDMTVVRDAATGLMAAMALDNITDSYTYNIFGELAQYTATGPGGPLFAAVYTRDGLGRITDKSETIGGATSASHYGYDPASRLTAVNQDTYTYDANGNRTSDNATYDDQDRLVRRGTSTYQFAAGGELSAKTVSGQQTVYEYDAFGSLRRVAPASGPEVRYTVDAEHRRIAKAVNGGLVKGFLYQDSGHIAAELDSADNVTSLFVYGDAAKRPVPGQRRREVSHHHGFARQRQVSRQLAYR